MEGSHRSSARQMKRGQHQGRSPGSLRALGTRREFYHLSGRTEQATPRIKKLQPWKPEDRGERFSITGRKMVSNLESDAQLI